MDWGLGRYESTAGRLAAAAAETVEAADVRAGERVVDVGCGTGNAALLAAARGCEVTGVDPTPRLLDVARARAAAEGLDAAFAQGEAAALPLADDSADAVLSVFAVIFAPDPAAAAAELARVAAPGGRIVLTAWVPEGPIHDYVAIMLSALAEAAGRPPEPPPFAWHDRDALTGLFGPLGLAVELSERAIAFTDVSARAYLETELRDHPMAVAGSAVLGRTGRLDEVFERALAVLEAANEDPAAFRVTSRFVVCRAA